MSFHFVVGEVQEISDALTASELGEFFFFFFHLIIIDKNYMFSSADEKNIVCFADPGSSPSYDVRVFEMFVRANGITQRLPLLCLTASQVYIQLHANELCKRLWFYIFHNSGVAGFAFMPLQFLDYIINFLWLFFANIMITYYYFIEQWRSKLSLVCY